MENDAERLDRLVGFAVAIHTGQTKEFLEGAPETQTLTAVPAGIDAGQILNYIKMACSILGPACSQLNGNTLTVETVQAHLDSKGQEA